MDKNMLRQSILRQKDERDHLLLRRYLERAQDAKVAKKLDTPLIKVILGPRRAGKSAFAINLLRNRPFMYYNFDDEVFHGTLSTPTDMLMELLHEVYGDIRTVFFDEIQNVAGWETFVNRLHRNGYNIVITGSNARLLSKELATALTGRHIPVEILPFSFAEIIPRHTGLTTYDLQTYWNKYLYTGGFPEVVLKDIDPDTYLDPLFESLILRDVVQRYHVRHAQQVNELGRHLISNFSSLYTARKIQKVFKNVSGLKSVATIQKFITYLEEAYILFSLGMYHAKSSLRVRSPKKIYAVDNGYIIAKAVRASSDEGKLLENAVFTELLKRGYRANETIFYYKTKNGQGREVDFVLKEDNHVTHLVQVCTDMSDPDTRTREIKALVEASKELSVNDLLILTKDHEETIEQSGCTIRVVPTWKWSLNRNM